MAGDKYLTHDGSGAICEVRPTQVGGAGAAEQILALDTNGLVPLSALPAGIGADVISGTTTEAIAAGAIVNIDGSGIRNADATTGGRKAVGFVNAAAASGATVDVFTSGIITGLSGLTPGLQVFLDTTAGQVTQTAPSADGNIVQLIGTAIDATTMSFEPHYCIKIVA